MITITENAKSQVISLLKEEEKDLDHFVRVAVKAGGCSGLSYDLTFDNETKEEDKILRIKELK